MAGLVLDCNIFGLQRFGGISNYWAQMMSRVDEDFGVHCTFIMPRDPLFSGIPHIKAASAIAERFPNRLARFVRAPVPAGTAVFHSSYYRQPARRVGSYIVSVYDFTYERYRTGLPRLVHRLQKEAAIRAADTVLCISESTRSDLLQQLPDVNLRKVHVTPLAMASATFYPDPVEKYRVMAPYVLFVGAREGYKRFDLAVDAMRPLTGLRLGIVGAALSDEERGQLTAKLGDRWIAFGSVSNEELRQVYSNAYAFIFPSDYEGFGLPLLEAMACGCPVVAADRSSFPEVVGAAGLLAEEQTADAYSALIARLEASALRSDLIARGFERAALFGWDKTFASTAAFYREALIAAG